MSDELKPCPFCGGEIIEEVAPSLGRSNWRAVCDDCGAEGPLGKPDTPFDDNPADTAIAAWNTRPQFSRTPPSPVEGDRGLIEALELRLLRAEEFGQAAQAEVDRLSSYGPVIETVREAGNALLASLDATLPKAGNRPTIAELEAILASDCGGAVEIKPDGSVCFMPRAEIEAFRALLASLPPHGGVG